MSKPFPEELLSAYLDGELTPEEAEVVRLHLAEGNSQQVENLDEAVSEESASNHAQQLQSLRENQSRLRQLPSFQLDEDFANRVMSKIEFAVDEEIDETASEPKVAVANHETAAIGSGQNWRMALAAIASLAALVLLALFLRPDPNTPTGVSVVPSLPDDIRDMRNGVAGEQDNGAPDSAGGMLEKKAGDSREDESKVDRSGDGGSEPVDDKKIPDHLKPDTNGGPENNDSDANLSEGNASPGAGLKAKQPDGKNRRENKFSNKPLANSIDKKSGDKKESEDRSTESVGKDQKENKNNVRISRNSEEQKRGKAGGENLLDQVVKNLNDSPRQKMDSKSVVPNPQAPKSNTKGGPADLLQTADQQVGQSKFPGKGSGRVRGGGGGSGGEKSFEPAKNEKMQKGFGGGGFGGGGITGGKSQGGPANWDPSRNVPPFVPNGDQMGNTPGPDLGIVQIQVSNRDFYNYSVEETLQQNNIKLNMPSEEQRNRDQQNYQQYKNQKGLQQQNQTRFLQIQATNENLKSTLKQLQTKSRIMPHVLESEEQPQQLLAPQSIQQRQSDDQQENRSANLPIDLNSLRGLQQQSTNRARKYVNPNELAPRDRIQYRSRTGPPNDRGRNSSNRGGRAEQSSVDPDSRPERANSNSAMTDGKKSAGMPGDFDRSKTKTKTDPKLSPPSVGKMPRPANKGSEDKGSKDKGSKDKGSDLANKKDEVQLKKVEGDDPKVIEVEKENGQKSKDGDSDTQQESDSLQQESIRNLHDRLQDKSGLNDLSRKLDRENEIESKEFLEIQSYLGLDGPKDSVRHVLLVIQADPELDRLAETRQKLKRAQESKPGQKFEDAESARPKPADSKKPPQEKPPQEMPPQQKAPPGNASSGKSGK